MGCVLRTRNFIQKGYLNLRARVVPLGCVTCFQPPLVLRRIYAATEYGQPHFSRVVQAYQQPIYNNTMIEPL